MGSSHDLVAYGAETGDRGHGAQTHHWQSREAGFKSSPKAPPSSGCWTGTAALALALKLSAKSSPGGGQSDRELEVDDRRSINLNGAGTRRK